MGCAPAVVGGARQWRQAGLRARGVAPLPPSQDVPGGVVV